MQLLRKVEVEGRTKKIVEATKLKTWEKVALAVAAGSVVLLAVRSAFATVTYPKEKGVYLYWSRPYDQGDASWIQTSIVDQLIAKGMQTIYISGISSGTWNNPEKFTALKTFVAYARSKGMIVYGVIFEDPVFVTQTDDLIRIRMQEIISQTSKIVDGYITDVEPHAIHRVYPQYPDFYQDAATTKYYLDGYVRIHQVMYSETRKANIALAFTCPHYYQTLLVSAGYSNGFDAMPSEFVSIMTYTSSADAMLSQVDATISVIVKPIVIGLNIKVGSGDPYLSAYEFGRAQMIIDNLYNTNNKVLGYAVFESSQLLTM